MNCVLVIHTQSLSHNYHHGSCCWRFLRLALQHGTLEHYSARMLKRFGCTPMGSFPFIHIFISEGLHTHAHAHTLHSVSIFSREFASTDGRANRVYFKTVPSPLPTSRRNRANRRRHRTLHTPVSRIYNLHCIRKSHARRVHACNALSLEDTHARTRTHTRGRNCEL